MKKLIFLVSLVLVGSCAISVYKTVELETNVDSYTGTKTIDTRISFPTATSQSLIGFRHQDKNGVKTNYLIGRFWQENWSFYSTVDILIDSKNNRIESIDQKREVKSNASVEETVYFHANDDLLNKLKNAKSVKMRFNGEKGVKEFEFDMEKLAMVKNWINQIEL